MLMGMFTIWKLFDEVGCEGADEVTVLEELGCEGASVVPLAQRGS